MDADNTQPVNTKPVDAPPATSPKKPRLWRRRGFKTAVSFCTLMAVIGACAGLYARATNYGQQVVAAHPVDARIEMANSPAYLDRRIVNALLDEAYQFAQRDEATFNRARNTLDGGILREIADLYTGTQTVQGQSVRRQTVGYNAWISNIVEVRREVAADKSRQTIQIFAQWRMPAAWVRVNDTLYLIDAQGMRLPGDYKLEDRGRSKLLVITGVELPVAGGRAGVPLPGEPWAAGKDGVLGGDLLAGMQLAGTLGRQAFAAQVAAIDVSNQGGRRDARAPWLVLDTIWQTAGGGPSVVQWGRPVGEESFYDVKAEVKIKNLNEIYQRFNRIDAGREYADIHTEVVKLSKLALGS